MKTTKLDNSYWQHTGAYQKELDTTYDKLVPKTGGSSGNIHGELVRSIQRLIYEFAYLGNTNARKYSEITHKCENSEDGECHYSCNICHGSGEYGSGEESISIDNKFSNYLNFIRKNVKNVDKEIKDIEDIILGNSKSDSMYKEMNKYDLLCDHVMYYVLNTKNKNR